MLAATLPYVTQNSDFALGGDANVTLLPQNFPNQVVCASSAGSMDDVFYKRYKEAAMHSMAGDKNYFCADIDCEVILHATYNGKVYPVPLLTQAKIDSEMKMNPTKATREYMNKFNSDLGDDIAVKKSQVLRNSVVRPPMFVNDDIVQTKCINSLRYEEFIAPMVKTIQYQQGKIEKQEEKIECLEERIKKLELIISSIV